MRSTVVSRLFCLVAAAALAACAGKCVIPDAGACSVDSDCALAFCGDVACPGCSAGSPIARSQLGESACLLEVGSTIPPACQQHEVCDLLCPCIPPARAACVGGTCVRIVEDGGCGG